MRRFFGILLVFVGIFVILIPFLENQYYTSQEQDLIESFQTLDRLFSEEQSIAYAEEGAESSSNHDQELGDDVLGLIHIDRIDLTLPMLQGATDENLDVGAGVLGESVSFGEVGNTGIAAHRSRTSGRLFNRLDEVDIGDSVTVETHDGDYEYEVFDTFIVEPDDISVLDVQEGESLITLITCTIDSTERIIVQAKLL
ncbi:class D sortase [Alkalibacillus silvisoli]|uniref:Class D sortase n=1 Tax=Alkalibacillus silvisoli TaxID=392823 RepID=A0ABN1A3Z3_9BACI